MKKTSGQSPPRDPRELERYRSKRDPVQTTEPFSAERKGSGRATRAGRFVVHLHQARREHYDLRIECGGTLQSFAVPRGPSLKPLEKRLAVHTENHPLEYLDFEAVIPEGNYGAGSMIVWDTGRIRYLETSAEEGLARGDLKFELSGFKLRGAFVLVRTSGRKEKLEVGDGQQSEWLLIKKQDIYASDQDIVAKDPRGVLSGLTAEENFDKASVVSEIEQLVEAAPAKALAAQGLTPMLCALEGAKLVDPERLYELKLDGVRIVAEKRGGLVALRYRNGRSATASYSEIARAISLLPIGDAVLDGEIVTFDAEGKPSFERLAPRIHAQKPFEIDQARAAVPVVYLVFDVLALAGRDLTGLPLLERKRILSRLVRGRGLVRVLDHIENDGSALYEFCRQQRLEGVVAKRKLSPYRVGPRRTTDWVKLKVERDDDFVVLGYVSGSGVRSSLGALCLGVYVEGELEYRGRVGSGLSDATIRVLLEALAPLEQAQYPGRGSVPEDPGTERARWVKPELVVQVRYHGFTEEGRLRAPVFLGLRPDIDPRECHASPPAPLKEPEPTATTSLGSGRVTISNPDKVFWPDSGYTKSDLCNYYATIAPKMLPFLRGRPLVLVRHPDGITGKSFYQWNVPEGTPSWMRRLDISDTDEVNRSSKNVFLVDDEDGLIYLANLGCIPLHVLACREHSLGTCDFITVDFDIAQRPFSDAVRCGLTLREVLEDAGLPGFPKTSGQRGLHVLIPLGNGIPFEAAKLLVELLGRIVTARHPTIATMERKVDKRGDRMYIDTGQTGTSRTIVAPYSVRAHPGATVSTPLAWEELHAGLDPSRFTIVTVPSRALEIDDPWLGFAEAKPNVASALSKLERWVKV
ncbi:MAG TPA: DNA ligase D [Polyangiaceae bacterium]|nr:DNA ligase D [Polyangiaceae bacterium]